MIAYIKNKKVLFITTKRLDYIRNTQEIRLLKQYASQFRIIGCFTYTCGFCSALPDTMIPSLSVSHRS